MDQALFDAAFNARGTVEYPRDCHHIVGVAGQRMNIIMTMNQAEQIWEYHSEIMCAGWLHIREGLDGDNDIVDAITSYVHHHTDLSG